MFDMFDQESIQRDVESLTWQRHRVERRLRLIRAAEKATRDMERL